MLPDSAKALAADIPFAIRRGISDPELQAKVTPDFQMGCKRILISNTYYPALAQDNVEVITDGIAEITADGIVTRDGQAREIDVLIVATGFYTTDQPIAHHIKGREGRTLGDVWSEHGMASYKGTTTAGFPNLFQIVGANTGLGHSSMVFIIESQIAYILSALEQMEANSAMLFHRWPLCPEPGGCYATTIAPPAPSSSARRWALA